MAWQDSGPMTKPRTHDEYLATLLEPQRAVLEALRATIRAAAPEAVETISYGVPTFKVGDRNLVHYAGYRDHLSFFPGSSATTDLFMDELGRFRTGRGTLQFTLDDPLPAELVTKVVQARLAEEAARRSR